VSQKLESCFDTSKIVWYEISGKSTGMPLRVLDVNTGYIEKTNHWGMICYDKTLIPYKFTIDFGNSKGKAKKSGATSVLMCTNLVTNKTEMIYHCKSNLPTPVTCSIFGQGLTECSNKWEFYGCTTEYKPLKISIEYDPCRQWKHKVDASTIMKIDVKN